MIVTKQQILNAISNEPIFTSGSFFRYLNNEPTELLKTCPVCAVGSVLRNTIDVIKVMNENARVSSDLIGTVVCHGLYSDHDLFLARHEFDLDPKNKFFSYLSCFFENEAERYIRELHPKMMYGVSQTQINSPEFQTEIKSRLIKFIEAYCPDEVELSYERLLKTEAS